MSSSFSYIPKVLSYTFLSVVPPSLAFYLYSSNSRSEHFKSLTETALPDSVVTISDMYVDAAAPGDIIMFKRKCHNCATPLAALACLAQQKLTGSQQYDHFGIVVPGESTYSKPNILEATPNGILSLIYQTDYVSHVQAVSSYYL